MLPLLFSVALAQQPADPSEATVQVSLAGGVATTTALQAPGLLLSTDISGALSRRIQLDWTLGLDYRRVDYAYTVAVGDRSETQTTRSVAALSAGLRLYLEPASARVRPEVLASVGIGCHVGRRINQGSDFVAIGGSVDVQPTARLAGGIGVALTPRLRGLAHVGTHVAVVAPPSFMMGLDATVGVRLAL